MCSDRPFGWATGPRQRWFGAACAASDQPWPGPSRCEWIEEWAMATSSYCHCQHACCGGRACPELPVSSYSGTIPSGLHLITTFEVYFSAYVLFLCHWVPLSAIKSILDIKLFQCDMLTVIRHEPVDSSGAGAKKTSSKRSSQNCPQGKGSMGLRVVPG